MSSPGGIFGGRQMPVEQTSAQSNVPPELMQTVAQRLGGATSGQPQAPDAIDRILQFLRFDSYGQR